MPSDRADLHLRLPAALHAELQRRATEQGVSLNQLAATLLAGAVGFRLAPTLPAGNPDDYRIEQL